MAITSNIWRQQMPTFDLEKMIKGCIQSMIIQTLDLRNDSLIRYVEFFPAYTTCEVTNEKTLASMFLKLRYQPRYTRIGAREIEVSGATVVEFIDFLHEKGATEILAPVNVLETI